MSKEARQVDVGEPPKKPDVTRSTSNKKASNKIPKIRKSQCGVGFCGVASGGSLVGLPLRVRGPAAQRLSSATPSPAGPS